MSLHLQNAMLYIFGVILNGAGFFYGAYTSEDSSKQFDSLFTHYTRIKCLEQYSGMVALSNSNITHPCDVFTSEKIYNILIREYIINQLVGRTFCQEL